jgi:hypothetical protein
MSPTAELLSGKEACAMSPKDYYLSFVAEHYCPKSFLVFTVLSAVYVVSLLGKLPSYGDSVAAGPQMLSKVLLLAAEAMLATIFFLKTKPVVGDNSLPRAKLVLSLQAVCPVAVAVALSLLVVLELSGQRCIESTMMPALISGLKAFPLLMFYMVRDTAFGSIVISWLVCVLTLLAASIYANLEVPLIAFLTYVAASGAILFDSHRQGRSVYVLIEKFHRTQEENERLAVEAQALELRAMIGNVAHDLKTVSPNLLCLAIFIAYRD